MLGCSTPSQSYRNNCVFAQIVIRMFVCLTLMFLGLALAVSLRNDKAKTINEGAWFFKLAVLLGLFGLTMLMGSGFIDLVYRTCLQCWLLYCIIQVRRYTKAVYCRARSSLELGVGDKRKVGGA